MNIVTVDSRRIKTGLDFGYVIGMVYLAPHTVSGYNVCPKASPGCINSCYNETGFGRFPITQNARVNRTRLYYEDREKFIKLLDRDIKALERHATRLGKKPAVRINGLSDLPALAISSAIKHPHIQHYDYTKILKTFDRELPPNYYLCFSESEINGAEVEEAIRRGINVVTVFPPDEPLPETYRGRKVIDGDIHDLRFLDPKNVIVGLRAIGEAEDDETGFVVNARNNS